MTEMPEHLKPENLNFLDYVVTCHVDGCENKEISINVNMPDNASIMCGPCGNIITDVILVG